MKYVNSKCKIVFITAIIFLMFFATPYTINPLILPGQNDPNADFFNGEWFNKSIDQYQILNRWAHYYGKHGCEPEWDNCPYRGVLGQWRLMLDYIREDKPLSTEIIQSK
ncbi:hypothetical protein SPSYN_03116 [Sporotomaculum syntrophicum]|uniref:Uncharacterized protein n=1 Tax=Sporotomaculum syntrophicum TaxID=182264 RepID=A0A9D2WNK2_9FIRM|nr:hypothetical protein [Sporotomaculum syntrophicum]KAF1083767.1 hypothetical protein SPSYN_03116 [Sporotomaculum syntrophicum]